MADNKVGALGTVVSGKYEGQYVYVWEEYKSLSIHNELWNSIPTGGRKVALKAVYGERYDKMVESLNNLDSSLSAIITPDILKSTKDMGYTEIGIDGSTAFDIAFWFGTLAAIAATQVEKPKIHTVYLEYKDGDHSILKISDSAYDTFVAISSQVKEPVYSQGNTIASASSNININPNNVAPTLDRIELFIEDGEWEKAEAYCDAALDYFPKDPMIYLYLLFVEKKVGNLEQLGRLNENLSTNSNFKRAIRFADEDLAKKLNSICASINDKIEEDNRLQIETQIKNENEKQVKIDSFRSIIKPAYKPVPVLSPGGFVIKPDLTLLTNDSTLKSWEDIVSITQVDNMVIGVKKDGSIVTSGKRCNAVSDVENWKDIVAVSGARGVSGGPEHIIGLKSDGTVVAAGGKMNRNQCNVSNWRDIVAISAGPFISVGLRKDGSVVATGWSIRSNPEREVANWRDIVAVYAGMAVDTSPQFALGQQLAGNHWYIAGLKSDGTVLTTGGYFQNEISGWNDIVALALTNETITGLRSDGTVVAAGLRAVGVTSWRDIVAISSADLLNIMGVRKDGSLIYEGNNSLSGKKVFNSIESLEQERVNAEAEIQEKRKLLKEQRKEKLIQEKNQLESELPNVKGLFANSKRSQMTNRIQEIEKELIKLEN